MLQRTSLQRLRFDAVAEPDRVGDLAAHARHGDLRDGQFARAVQSTDTRRGRIRDDRLHLRWEVDRGFPGRDADGYLLLLWSESIAAARALPGSARPDNEGVAARRYVRVQRPVQPAALREHLAAARAASASADLDSRRRLDRDMAVVREDGLRLRVS